MGIRCPDHVTPLYPQKLALTSPTGGGCSVGIVNSRTKATEVHLVGFTVEIYYDAARCYRRRTLKLFHGVVFVCLFVSEGRNNVDLSWHLTCHRVTVHANNKALCMKVNPVLFGCVHSLLMCWCYCKLAPFRYKTWVTECSLRVTSDLRGTIYEGA